MRKLLGVVVVFGIILWCFVCHAATTFSKVSDSVIKITTTTVTESVVVNDKTIAQLKTERANIAFQKSTETDAYNARIVILDLSLIHI